MYRKGRRAILPKYIGNLPYYRGTADSYFTQEASEKLDGILINSTTGAIQQWYSQGALSDFKGEENTKCFNQPLYPAGYYCTTFHEGLSGWYLPSAGELALLWAQHRSNILSQQTHHIFEDFSEFGYWTSSEYDESNAWYINFYSGVVCKNSKWSNYHIRPVIRF